MINLEVFFRNHFDTKEISDNNLKLFAEVHLQRITANNPGGIYSTRITAVTTAYTNYFGAISNEDVKFALQQGMSITMNNAYDNFVHTVQQKEGIIRGTWGVTSSQYQEFFPNGLNEYNESNLGNIELLMNRMVEASTAHVADLGAPFVTLFTNLRTTFTNARTAQLAVMGEVEGLKSTAEINRNVLEEELMINLLIVASNNVGHPEMLPDYFDQSIVRRPGSGDELIEKFTLPGNQTVYNVELPSNLTITANTEFRVKNKATGTAGHLAVGYFAFTATDDPGEPPMGYVFNPGDNKVVAAAANLSWIDGKAFLNFMAPGPDPVEIEVYLVG